MSTKITVGLLAALLAIGSRSGLAAELCAKTSPTHRIALVELYTSEGCSSCPPADNFVRTLYPKQFSSDELVPLSLHVDYWDYIGWRDRFADARFTRRQYWLSAFASQRSVYTPEIFVDGHEQDWRSNRFRALVRALNAQDATVRVRLSQAAAAPGQFAVRADAQTLDGVAGAPLSLYFAVYENELESTVSAGENRGATLRHGFVVRQWSAPQALDSTGHAEISWQQALPQDARADKLGFAAFVEDTRSGEILQALALDSCAKS